MKKLALAFGAVLLSSSMAVQANVVTLSGSNVGARDLYTGFPAFHVDFKISGLGIYTFQTTAATFDTFIELYPAGLLTPAATFNPIAFDDDSSPSACGAFFCSLISDLPLNAGAYSLFVRGASGEVGAFGLRLQSVQGADIALVPVPASLPLLGLGLAGLVLVRRQKAAVAA